MSQSNQVFIITLAMIGLGFLLKNYNFLSEQDGKTISKFLMHTTFPALMIISTAKVKLDTSLLFIPLFCIAISVIMLLIAWFWFSKYPNNLRGLLTMAAGGTNVGLFGYPIITGLFGKDALVYAVMFDIGNTIIVFGAVYPIGTYFSSNKKEGINFKQILKKILTLPPVLGMILGLIINASSITMPVICEEFLDILAKANKPLVLLLMGIYLSFELNKKLMLAISKVLLIRYSISLAVVFALYFLLSAHPMMRNVLMICTLLPLGMTILPFSDELNYDSRIAGTLINISLLISFILMWAMVLILGI
jgi:malate permease and related proteins